MDAKKQAALFRKKFRLNTINSATLSEALKEQGYIIIEFNGIHDKNAVVELIDALQLKGMVAQSRCFTYHDENYRLVFLHEDLNDEERTIVLAHEAGHIWNRHMNQGNVIGTDVVQEFEANEFAHYLLLGRTRNRRKCFLIAAACIVLAIMCAVIILLAKQKHDQAHYTEDLYRVSDGKKYHLRDCTYIKDRKDVTRLTWAEYESGEYEPCSVCKPEQSK
jgi:hypothetical protein